MNDNYNKGFGGQVGDRTDFDYRRGEYDRSRLLEGRSGSSGGGGGGAPPGGGAAGGGGGGVILLVLLPVIAIIAVSVLSIGLIIAAMMVILLNVLPGHSRVSFGGAMKLGFTGAIGALIGLALCYGVVSVMVMMNAADFLWLLVPISLELTSLAGSAPLLLSLLDGPASLPPVPVELHGLLIAKALMWGPAVLMFAKVYSNNASFRILPRKMLFFFGIGLAVLALSVAFPIAGWIADRLVENFALFTDRAVVTGPASTLGLADVSIASIPAGWALGVYFAGGAIAGLVFVALSQLYKGSPSARGYLGAAFKWGFLYLLAGAVTLLVMTCWPAADALVAWAFDTAMPAHLRELAAADPDGAATPPDLFAAMPGFLIASLPAIAILAWAIHASRLFRKNAAFDFTVAALMAIWPLLIIGPVAAVVGLGQLFALLAPL